MKYLVRKGEMKQYDRNTIEYYGIPSMVLIERAALAAEEELEGIGMPKQAHILVACGNGNNGADGLVLARLLFLKGHHVDILIVGDQGKATAENKNELAIAKKYHINIWNASEWAEKDQISVSANAYDIVVDAIFGVGLSRKIEGIYGQVIAELNQMDARRVALDIPSGIDADDGSVLGIAFQADMTITFSYEKVGMRLYPGQEYCGKIICRRVGIDDLSFLAETGLGKSPTVMAYEMDDLELLPKRRGRTNKGSYGKVLVIGGSLNMAGAGYLCARAAYLAGCGLVRVLTPEENRLVIQNLLPEAILTTYNNKKPDREQIIQAIQWADVIVCGPGIGLEDTARLLVKLVLKNATVPVVMDADALNILAEEPEALLKPHTEMIVTPHLGEMARLQRATVSYIQDHLMESAEEFARTYQVICTLKDARTVTAVPFENTFVNLSGNNGMATGGSGDVLTGIIGGLIAQGAKPEQAAPLGVYIHGLAGDLAAEKMSAYSMTARDILCNIPEVINCRKEGKIENE